MTVMEHIQHDFPFYLLFIIVFVFLVFLFYYM